MKRKAMYILIVMVFTLLGYLFFNKKHIEHELLFKIPNSDNKFYPNAYEFFHSKESITRYFNRNDKTREYQKTCQNIDFDFNKNSYVIVYGKKVKKMYHSYKTSLINDISPSYSKPKDKTLIIIEYDKDSDEGVFIYRIEKNTNFRGFYGV